MTFSSEQVEALNADLARLNVRERKQAGRQLSYIEGWWAEVEANRIFGHHAWDSETIDLRVVAENPRKIGDAGNEGWGVSYIAKVRITVTTAGGHKVIREGVGAGHGIDRDLGLAHESAAKEAATDAEKRGLKTFGFPFGLALYDKSQAHVSDAAREPAPQQTQGRKSAAQAKRDKDDEIIKTAISNLSLEGLAGWNKNFEQLTAHVPASWLDSIQDMLVMRAEELNAEPIDGEAEMDRQFAETVR